jgi:hypothetical protein
MAPESAPKQGEPKWWWVSFLPFDLSIEERRAGARLLLTTLFVFILLCGVEVPLLMWIGVEQHIVPIVGTFTALAPAFCAARPICSQIWPEVIRKGDDKAAIRLAARKRT